MEKNPSTTTKWKRSKSELIIKNASGQSLLMTLTKLIKDLYARILSVFSYKHYEYLSQSFVH